jgi:diguanylate cyclase (GGDEF)-like protein
MEQFKPKIENYDKESLLRELEKLEASNRNLVEEVARLAAENEHLERELERHEPDELTGLMRGAEFSSLLQDHLNNLKPDSEVEEKRKERFGYTTMAVLYCDLDGFKSMNDNYLHSAGDEVLKAVADIFRDRLRSTDLICRRGGDEFVINLLGADEADALSIAKNLCDTVRNTIREKFGKKYSLASISLSVGVRVVEKDDPKISAEQLIKEADAAMYKAKENGKDAAFSWLQVTQADQQKKAA